MGFREDFVKIKPRETSGPTSSSRFDYQKDISLNILLEYEENDKDYIFIFDYHEDLVIMDCEKEPQKVSFYQIKGKKNGSWTLSSLIKSELDKDKKPLLCILSKLYDCKDKFPQQTTALNFISNSRFGFKLNDGTKSDSKDEVFAFELTAKDKEIIKKNLKEKLALKEDPDYEDLIIFKVMDLSLNDSERHVKGILIDFFQKKFNVLPNVDVLYKSFFNEIKKRANYNKSINSFDDLIKNKAITKSTFNGWLNAIIYNEQSLKEKWQELFAILQGESIGHSLISKIKKGWTTFELHMKDPNNVYMISALKIVEDTIQTEKDFIDSNLLLDSTNYIYEKVKDKVKPPLYDEFTTKAIILNSIYA